MTEGDDRLARAVRAMGDVVGRASDPNGDVTVEVGIGGKLRSVRITPRATRYGARYLADTVLKTAATATALANHQAHQLYQQALGGRGDRIADQLGLTYDPALVSEQDNRRRRGRAAPAPTADDEDYPESWLH